MAKGSLDQSWRRKFGGMDATEAKRLKALEDENLRLKQIVANPPDYARFETAGGATLSVQIDPEESIVATTAVYFECHDLDERVAAHERGELGVRGLDDHDPDLLAQVARDRAARSGNRRLSDEEVAAIADRGDFEIAVEEGSTMLRLGTILFGERTQ